MRRAMTLIVAASLAAAPGCSDRSPTSPMASTAASSEAAQAPAPGPVARPRNVVVIPPRGDGLPPGTWGSAEASLSVGPAGAKLEILSLNLPTGACFGMTGEIGQKIPGGQFSLPGIFTQLIGAYPGRIDYAAQYSGVVAGNTMSLTVMIPALELTFGPYVLVRGVTNSWTPCLYPGAGGH